MDHAGSGSGSLARWQYPDEFVCEYVDESGVLLTVRPIRPEDGEALAAFHRRLTPTTVYQRYLAVRPELSSSELRHLTEVDYVDRLALVAVLEGAIVGVARYERERGMTEAEVAFVVEDAVQRRGIGTLLLDRLAHAAFARGVECFSADTFVTNAAMVAVFVHAGFPVEVEVEEGVAHIRFSVDPAQRGALRRRCPSPWRRSA